MFSFRFIKICFFSGMAALASVALVRCGSALDGTQSAGAITGLTSSVASSTVYNNLTVNWGSSNNVESGIATTSLSMTGIAESGAEANFPTCFDNNRACRRAAASVQAVVGNDPVLVQGFQIDFTYQDSSGSPSSTGRWSQITVDAASVSTAELRFNSTTGALSMGPIFTKQLVAGTTCDLGNSYAVGYTSSAGNEQLLVGMRFFEEASLLVTGANNEYSNAYVTSSRVWHSGVFPQGNSSAYSFQFEPISAATTVDFGLNDFAESSSSSVVASPYFGLQAQTDLPTTGGYGNYLNHVIVGYCLIGRKIGWETRPLLYYSNAYLRRPYLQQYTQ